MVEEFRRIDNAFWKRWDDANELEKPKLVQELTLVKYNKYLKKGYEYGFTSLLNSYFEDLQEYLEDKKKNG